MSSDSSRISRSIVIPNYNNADRLSQCLQAVTAQADDTSEIIVVDNQSTDNSRDIANSFDIKLFQETTYQSPYACRHRGILKARGEIIILLDSNCIPLEHWFEEGCRALEREQVDIISGTLVPEYQYHPPGRLERFDFLHSIIKEDNPSLLPAGNLFFERALYTKVGTFNASRRSLEDTQWTARAVRKGFRLGVSPKARFSYPMKSGEEFREKYMRFGNARIKEGAHFGWMLLKNILPPNPAFHRRIMKLNREEDTGLSAFSLFLICWYVKLLYGLGALKGKPNR